MTNPHRMKKLCKVHFADLLKVAGIFPTGNFSMVLVESQHCERCNELRALICSVSNLAQLSTTVPVPNNFSLTKSLEP